MLGDAMVDAGSVLRDSAASDAHAQAPSDCSRWEISWWERDDDGNDAASIASAIERTRVLVPADWEPLTAGAGDSDGVLFFRRCTD